MSFGMEFEYSAISVGVSLTPLTSILYFRMNEMNVFCILQHSYLCDKYAYEDRRC